MIEYAFQNTQSAQELVFTKGLFFAESFFAYNYALAEAEGAVRWICGAGEVWVGWFSLRSLTPSSFTCISETDS